MAYAYTVKGSEDGIIGVYTSYKKAVIRAKQYVNDSTEKNIFDDVEVNMRSKFYSLVHSEESRVEADVERHYLD